MTEGGMDSKVVDRDLRAELWPALKAAGFGRRSGRTAWRDQGEAVQCVSVRSFNTYLADLMGATTYSIGVNLGVFFSSISDRGVMGGYVRDRARPKVAHCHLRRILTKGFAQAIQHQSRLSPLDPRVPTLGQWADRPDLWLVLPDGSNLTACVRDVAERVASDGLPWLDRLSDPAEAIRSLMEEPNVYGDRGVLLEWYGGAPGSPSRWQKVGALAAALGDADLLSQAVDQMKAQRYWVAHPHDLDRLRAELAALS